MLRIGARAKRCLSKVPAEIIKVQVGEYVEEDDIVKLEDKYERE